MFLLKFSVLVSFRIKEPEVAVYDPIKSTIKKVTFFKVLLISPL